MYQTAGSEAVRKQAEECIGVPFYVREIRGRSKNVSLVYDNDVHDDADDVNEDGSGGDVGGVDGVGVEATMTITTIMKTTMTAATQQSNGARIGEGTTTATAMSTMSTTTMVVVTKAAVMTEGDN